MAQREMSFNDTHSKAIGYLLWIFGFTGAHRFYYGKPVTGTLWFLTLGLFGIGWLIDLFLIPAMDREAASDSPPPGAAWLSDHRRRQAWQGHAGWRNGPGP